MSLDHLVSSLVGVIISNCKMEKHMRMLYLFRSIGMFDESDYMRKRHVQDIAWMIDLHLIKHSGNAGAAVLVGGHLKAKGTGEGAYRRVRTRHVELFSFSFLRTFSAC